MKKIASFITAALIFIVIITVVHVNMDRDLSTNNKAFSTWVNQYKSISYKALADNINEDTMLVFGSSEFGHGKKSAYHPANLFKEQNVDLMLVGGAYNQCLSHTIALGALENKVEKKKVVLILSPTWFYEEGVKPENYSLRFSESSYMEFMENPDISKEVKAYVGKRSEKLLSTNKSMKHRVKGYNEMFVDGESNFFSKFMYKIRKGYVEDRDIISVKEAMKSAQIKKKNKKEKMASPTTLDWHKLSAEAIAESLKDRDSRFNMSEKVYKKKLESKIKSRKNSHKNDSFDKSPEYDDLECFLKVCKETGIDVMLVLQPLNGEYYDYTGLTSEKRQVFRAKALELADKYEAQVADFSNEEYSKYFFEDSVHPAQEGWVKINEKIYDFYEQNQGLREG